MSFTNVDREAFPYVQCRDAIRCDYKYIKDRGSVPVFAKWLVEAQPDTPLLGFVDGQLKVRMRRGGGVMGGSGQDVGRCVLRSRPISFFVERTDTQYRARVLTEYKYLPPSSVRLPFHIHSPLTLHPLSARSLPRSAPSTPCLPHSSPLALTDVETRSSFPHHGGRRDPIPAVPTNLRHRAPPLLPRQDRHDSRHRQPEQRRAALQTGVGRQGGTRVFGGGDPSRDLTHWLRYG